MSQCSHSERAKQFGLPHGDDAAALKTLENGLSRYTDASSIDRARALLFQDELATRLGKRAFAQSPLAEAKAMALGDERDLIADELAHTTEIVAGITESDAAPDHNGLC